MNKWKRFIAPISDVHIIFFYAPVNLVLYMFQFMVNG